MSQLQRILPICIQSIAVQVGIQCPECLNSGLCRCNPVQLTHNVCGSADSDYSDSVTLSLPLWCMHFGEGLAQGPVRTALVNHADSMDSSPQALPEPMMISWASSACCASCCLQPVRSLPLLLAQHALLPERWQHLRMSGGGQPSPNACRTGKAR